MSFHKATVLLRLDSWKLDFFWRKPEVDPRRHLRRILLGLSSEEQLRDNLLHPGCAGLGIGRNDNVVVPKLKIVPNSGIDVLVMHLSGLLRPGNICRDLHYSLLFWGSLSP